MFQDDSGREPLNPSDFRVIDMGALLLVFIMSAVLSGLGGCSEIPPLINKDGSYEEYFSDYLKNPFVIVDAIAEGGFDLSGARNVSISRGTHPKKSIAYKDLFSRKRSQGAFKVMYIYGYDRLNTINGEWAIVVGKYTTAINKHAGALMLREKFGKPIEIAQSHAYLGLSYFFLGSCDLALPHFRAAEKLYIEMGNFGAADSAARFIAMSTRNTSDQPDAP